MKHWRLWWCPAMAVATALVACAPQVPVPEGYPVTTQKKAQAVHHWDVLAQDIAARTVEKLRQWPKGQYPITVVVPGDAPFHHSLQTLLITHLTDAGVVLTAPPAALVPVLPRAATSLQPQPMADAASPTSVVQPPMPVTAMPSASAPAAAVAPETAVPGAPPAVLTLLVVDSQVVRHTDGAGANGLVDVLITTSLESGERVLARTSDLHYVAMADVHLYLSSQELRAQELAQAKQAPAPLPAPIKQWKVVAP